MQNKTRIPLDMSYRVYFYPCTERGIVSQLLILFLDCGSVLAPNDGDSVTAWQETPVQIFLRS